MSDRRMRFVALLLGMTLVVSCTGWLSTATARAQIEHGYELFYSEQTGYFMFWNPAYWTLEDQPPGSGGDWLRLRDDEHDAVGELFAFQAPGITTTECLHTILDELARAPTTVTIEALSEEGGAPQLSESGGDQVEAHSSD